jgi:hypothetical protein
MIILSVGMPRAGSGWYYNLMHDMVVVAGGQDARQIRQRFHLQGVLTEVNCNIGALTPRRLMAVLRPSLAGNTFVIKAHAAPTWMAILFIRLGWMRAAYIFRDPRDAMLSAFENGRRAAEKGFPNAFSDLTDFDHALEFIQGYVKISEDWLDCKYAFHTRYEDLLINYPQEIISLLSFLKLDDQNAAVQQVVEKYRPEQANTNQKGLHFSQGKIGRFRQKWSPEQQEYLRQRFNPYLNRTGYKV